MPKKGWVKLYRSISGNWVYDDPEKLKIWITLLIKATHKKFKANVGYELVELQPGELIFGTRKFADEVDINQNKVYQTVKLFEDDGMIEYDTESYKGKFSIIRILNWEKYQTPSTTENKEVAEDGETQSKRPNNASQTQDKRTTNASQNVQECKELKNVKNTSSSTSAGTRESDNNKGVSSDIKIRNWLHTYWGRKEVTEKRVQALVKFTDKVDLDLIKDAIIRSQNARDPFTYCCGSYDDDYVLKGGMLNKCINQGVTCIEDLQNNSGGDDGGERSRGDQEKVRDNDREKQAKHRARRI